MFRSLLPLAVLACAAEGPAPGGMTPQNPSPMVETVREHARSPETLPPGRVFWINVGLPNGVPVFIPNGVTDSASLLVHFHGGESVAPHAAARAPGPVVSVAVQLGAGSSAYEGPVSDGRVFGNIVRAVSDSVRITQTVVSAFSAGYGAVRALLREAAGAIDAVILLDGLHTDYHPDGVPLAEGGELNEEKLDPFLEFARRAIRAEGRFVITHSSAFPGAYASTTETTEWIGTQLGLPRRAVLEWGPGGMQQISEMGSGGFRVMGFAGNTAPDHVDHLHALVGLLPGVLRKP